MIKLLVPALVLLFQTSIYTHTITSINDTEINFSSFEGKKILVVNIATDSPLVGQLAELQQLHQEYGDSLVIVGFPSNSFETESRTNSQVLEFCQSQYNVNFLLAAKGEVAGESMQPFYQWLTNKTENGVFGYAISDDFQKYLFDRNGNAIGVFAGRVSPLSTQVRKAITGTQN